MQEEGVVVTTPQVSPGLGVDTLEALDPQGPLDPQGTAAGAPSGDESDLADGDAEPRRLVDDAVLEAAPQGGVAAATVPQDEDALVIPPDYPLPASGQRLVVQVAPGEDVRLEDPAFDPSRATYAVDGNDLVVTLANGGTLILAGFFSPAGADQAMLSVLQGPQVAASALLQQAEAAPQPSQYGEVQPAVEPQGPQSAGGGAAFRPYVPGDIGPGLAITGVLPPTSLFYSVQFDELQPFAAQGDETDGPGPGPGPGPGSWTRPRPWTRSRPWTRPRSWTRSRPCGAAAADH